MSADKKPKEYWINIGRYSGDAEAGSFYSCILTEEQKTDDWMVADVSHFIHVVEFEAYEALVKENEELRKSLATRSKLLLEAHKILLNVYDTDRLSLETKLAASKLLDKIELDESLFEIEKTKE